MKYSLALLFVAATAILVSGGSRPMTAEEFAKLLAEMETAEMEIPPPSQPDAPGPVPRERKSYESILNEQGNKERTVEELNVILKARENNQLRVGMTLAELQLERQLAERNGVEFKMVPCDVGRLETERNEFKERLAVLLAELETAQKDRAADKALAKMNRDALKKGAKQLIVDALTVEELNQLLSELARNAAQRTQYSIILRTNGAPQVRVKELTHLDGSPLKLLSENKLHYLKDVLRIFVGPKKSFFLPILAQAGVCTWHPFDQNLYGVRDPVYIIAEKIWDASEQVLKNVLDTARARFGAPIGIFNSM